MIIKPVGEEYQVGKGISCMAAGKNITRNKGIGEAISFFYNIKGEEGNFGGRKSRFQKKMGVGKILICKELYTLCTRFY